MNFKLITKNNTEDCAIRITRSEIIKLYERDKELFYKEMNVLLDMFCAYVKLENDITRERIERTLEILFKSSSRSVLIFVSEERQVVIGV